jgi:hypothetical protein
MWKTLSCLNDNWLSVSFGFKKYSYLILYDFFFNYSIKVNAHVSQLYNKWPPQIISNKLELYVYAKLFRFLNFSDLKVHYLI